MPSIGALRLLSGREAGDPAGVAAAARQRPSRAGYRARVRMGEAARDQRQCFVIDQAAQQLDVFDGLTFVRRPQGFENLGHGAIAELAQFLERFFGNGRSRIGLVSNLRN